MAIKNRRPGNKNPPILSHEFVIQNHADIVACGAMSFVVGLIFQTSSPFSTLFIALHHNATRNESAAFPYEEETLYTSGWKDVCAIFFYTLIAIVLHALVQEYILDKITRKLHLSKIRHSKFNDAGQLLAFSLAATAWSGYIIWNEKFLVHIALLWEEFPHLTMSFSMKLFMIAQLSYWLHWLPEIYFLRMKKDEIPRKTLTSALFFSVVAIAYVTNLTRVCTVLLFLHFVPEIFLNFGKLLHFAEKAPVSTYIFLIGNLVFIFARFFSVIIAVLTFWFGLEPFASLSIRFDGLAVVAGLQSYLLFQFCIFQVKRLRGGSATATAAVKSPKKVKKTAKEISDLPEADQHAKKQSMSKKLKQK